MSSRAGRNDFSFILLVLGICFLYKRMRLVWHVGFIAIVFIAIAVSAWLLLRLYWRKKPKIDLTDVDHLTGIEFEYYVSRLLKTKGYSHIQLTEKYDLGIDIIAVKDNVRWGFQVKRYSGLVGVDSVRQVVTALAFYKCHKGVVITNSTFSISAKKLAKANDCLLIDKYILCAWGTD